MPELQFFGHPPPRKNGISDKENHIYSKLISIKTIPCPIKNVSLHRYNDRKIERLSKNGDAKQIKKNIYILFFLK